MWTTGITRAGPTRSLQRHSHGGRTTTPMCSAIPVFIHPRWWLTGSSSLEGAAREPISEASRMAKTTVNLRLAGDADKPGIPLEVRIEKLAGATAGERADVFLTITESRLHSDVVGGENSGRKLDHTAVVRRLERLGNADAQAEAAFAGRPIVKLSANWNRSNLRAVVFIQEQRSRRILGAAEIPLS